MSSTGSSRGNPSMGDVLRSVAVLGLIVLAVWGFGRFFTDTPDEDPVKAIDFAGTVKSARPAAEFPLLAPKGLPEGWKATSARFTPTSWHLGVLTDDEDYVGLEQSKLSAVQMVEKFAKGGKEVGTATIGGKTWTIREGPGNDVAFVSVEDGVTSLVVGEAPHAEVEGYVASLSTS